MSAYTDFVRVQRKKGLSMKEIGAMWQDQKSKKDISQAKKDRSKK